MRISTAEKNYKMTLKLPGHYFSFILHCYSFWQLPKCVQNRVFEVLYYV